jgi:hypothetical protein
MSDDDVQLLFRQFIRLRQAGYGRNDAWFEIEETARGLPQLDQKRLTSLLQRWEKQIAAQAESPASHTRDPYRTKDQPPDGWEQARQYAAEERRRHVIRRIASQDADGNGTQDVSSSIPTGHGIPCPQCKKMNSIRAVYCYSCGMPMGAATTANATRQLDGSEIDNAYFDENTVLFLKVQRDETRIRVDPGTNETILGRKTADSVMIPDIDLSPFQAGEHGVSRLHASLRRENDTVVMTDLGSKNHTHINGQRLHAHEVRVLHDGDEIRLGNLVMYIYFASK